MPQLLQIKAISHTKSLPTTILKVWQLGGPLSSTLVELYMQNFGGRTT